MIKKESLRTDIYQLIKDENLKCIYEAIHVEGFYADHKRTNDIIKEETIASDIKISSNPEHDSLHVELFQGLFCKAIAYRPDNFGDDYELIFLSDNIDNPILKDFKRSAKSVTDFSPTERIITGYDTSKKEIVKWTMQITLEIPESYGFSELESAVYEVEIEPKNSGLTLVADILANSINYIFSSREKKDIGKPLNDRKSIINHPLIDQFYGLMGEEDQVWVNDRLYIHPNERNRIEKKA